MSDRLYTDYPELYDAIQSEWDYERDVAFVEAARERDDVDGDRLLEIGCGTGEHTKRFVEAGYDVTAIDPAGGMLSLAREKCGDGVTVLESGLPDPGLEGAFDVVVAIRGVVNHLPPGDLASAFESVADLLADGGVFVFDNSPLPPEGNHPAIDVGEFEDGTYARIVQMNPTGDGRLSWDAVIFRSDGEFFIDSREMTPFEDLAVAEELSQQGFRFETHEGFGPDDARTVFVATR
ncbi:MAG: SAM-dependent methyltransferase [Halobacteriales archaeon]|jgi:SAM-dependent methyltransferase